MSLILGGMQFETEGAAWVKQRCPDGLKVRMHLVLESEEELSWLDGEFARRRPDKQTALVSDRKE